MKNVFVILFIFMNFNIAQARMVEDGMGYHTKKPVPTSTYQKWLSLKAGVEKKVRVFFGIDKTDEEVAKKLEEKASIIFFIQANHFRAKDVCGHQIGRTLHAV